MMNLTKGNSWTVCSRLLNCKAVKIRIFSTNLCMRTSNIKSEKPLVLFLPWLGATSRAIQKFDNLYSRYDFEILVHTVDLKDFLWPKTGIQNSLGLLENLKKKVCIGEYARPLIIHSFSIGCYFYALMLLHMKNDPQMHGIVENSIAAQILDSPVVGTLNEMANGVSKMLSPNSAMKETLYKNLCMLYFSLTRAHTVHYYEKAIAAVKYDALNVPSLTLGSEKDPMLIPKAFEELNTIWWQNNYNVQSKLWKDSGHTKHYKCHPEEYTALIDDLLTTSLNPNLVIK